MCDFAHFTRPTDLLHACTHVNQTQARAEGAEPKRRVTHSTYQRRARDRLSSKLKRRPLQQNIDTLWRPSASFSGISHRILPEINIYPKCLQRKSRFIIPTSIPTRNTSTGEEFHSFFHWFVHFTFEVTWYFMMAVSVMSFGCFILKTSANYWKPSV